MYLVYKQGLKGPEAYKCDELPMDGYGKNQTYLKCIKIDKIFEICNLTQLINIYPYDSSL